MSAPNEIEDLAMVERLVFDPHNLTLKRFSDKELKLGKTPDWQVYFDDKLVAYCEVKSPRDDWLDDELGNASLGKFVGGFRNDPIPNRIARLIKKAVKQLIAVNGSHSVPNILVFMNHDTNAHWGDLKETLTGDIFCDDGKRLPGDRRIAERWLGSDRYIVDLYVWIDASKRKISGRFFSEADLGHKASICKLLKLDPSTINR